ncbi:unnamed protein product [[Candida] boidinii]|nr:hypothetical protein BVG19_g810 [[Candida] boidinii]OWB50822.1 hypothetical protein B5S27_g2375 [[Candida] boidinii]GME97317.1 unnamed protein product [[Candida] boidinii]
MFKLSKTLTLTVKTYSKKQILATGVRFNSSKPPSFLASAPGPPKLSKEEQEEFEKLVVRANTQETIEKHNEEVTGEALADAPPRVDVGNFASEFLRIIPEFEGDTNPKTGEVGGPKQDPLKHESDWSYNGRVTDF